MRQEFWEKFKSSDLTAPELKFLRYIEINIDSHGVFTKSNVEIAKEFGVGDRTITRWVSSLEREQLITSFINHRRKIRNIRLSYVKKDKTLDYEEMSPAQKQFQDAFPLRKVNADVPDTVDMPKLIEIIKHSKFLQAYQFTSLKWFLKHYDEIMQGKYPGTNRAQQEDALKLTADIDSVEIG